MRVPRELSGVRKYHNSTHLDSRMDGGKTGEMDNSQKLPRLHASAKNLHIKSCTQHNYSSHTYAYKQTQIKHIKLSHILFLQR